MSGRVGHSNEQSVTDTSESEDARPALFFIPYISPLLNFRSYRYELIPVILGAISVTCLFCTHVIVFQMSVRILFVAVSSKICRLF